MKTREILRAIMWERMPELRDKNRETEEEIYIKESKLDEYPIHTPGNTQQPTTPTQPTTPPAPEEDPAPGAEDPEGQLPDEDPPVDAAPPEADQETSSDRDEVVQEIRDAIEEAIQTEEGANNND